MGYSSKVIADSINEQGIRLTTLEITYPRCAHAELMTHRVMSRNSASSRAIPIIKEIKSVWNNPYVPDHFGSAKKGMQSGPPLTRYRNWIATKLWLLASYISILIAFLLYKVGVHKEYTNRLLEPFLFHTVIVTSTEWDNFFNLRCNENAFRPIRIIAEMMRESIQNSTPKQLNDQQWHLPYISDAEMFSYPLDMLIKVSVARCARVSYLTHDGKKDYEADVKLYDRLLKDFHMSPFEHSARPSNFRDYKYNGRKDFNTGIYWYGNFKGWVSHRKIVEWEYTNNIQ